MKQKIVLATVGLICLIGVYWLGTHAFLEVTLPNSSGGNATYTITNLGNEKKTVLTSSKGSVKKLLPSGTYQVLVQQDGGSYLTTAQTKRFLQKNTVSSTLTKERARQFVGTNPAPCMAYEASVLYSFECNSLVSSITKHVPATATSPSYVLPNTDTKISGQIEGIVHTNEGIVALLKTASADQGEIAHYVYVVAPDFKTATLKNKFTAKDITRLYAAKPYRGGFVTYETSTLGDIKYFATAAAQPTTITIDKPTDSSFKPAKLNTSEDALVVHYTNNLSGEVADLEGRGLNRKVKNVIYVHSNNTTKQFTFTGQMNESMPCGAQLLCALQDQHLTVYNIAGDKPKAEHTIVGIHEMFYGSRGLFVIGDNDQSIFSFNPQSGSGYVAYDLGKYHPCGLTPTTTGLLVCTIDPKGTKRALALDLDTADTSAVDKKLLNLQGISQIKTLSIQGKFIYIVPELGKLEYVPSLRRYDYDPAVKQAINKIINDKITSLGLDKSGYTIVNTGQY